MERSIKEMKGPGAFSRKKKFGQIGGSKKTGAKAGKTT